MRNKQLGIPEIINIRDNLCDRSNWYSYTEANESVRDVS